MFKDHAMQVRMVRQPANAEQSPPPRSEWNPEAVSNLLQDQIGTVLITGAFVYVIKVAADTVSTVIIKKTKQR